MNHGSREYILDQACVNVSNALHLELDRLRKKRDKQARKVSRLLEKELAIERSITALQVVRGDLASGKMVPIRKCVTETCLCEPHGYTIDGKVFFCEGRESPDQVQV